MKAASRNNTKVNSRKERSKYCDFEFVGQTLDFQIFRCKKCSLEYVVHKNKKLSPIMSFKLKIDSFGYEVAELYFTDVSYTNYKFLSKLIKKFNDEIKDSQVRPDINIIEPYSQLCRLNNFNTTLCEASKPVALTEEEAEAKFQLLTEQEILKEATRPLDYLFCNSEDAFNRKFKQ